MAESKLKNEIQNYSKSEPEITPKADKQDQVDFTSSEITEAQNQIQILTKKLELLFKEKETQETLYLSQKTRIEKLEKQNSEYENKVQQVIRKSDEDLINHQNVVDGLD